MSIRLSHHSDDCTIVHTMRIAEKLKSAFSTNKTRICAPYITMLTPEMALAEAVVAALGSSSKVADCWSQEEFAAFASVIGRPVDSLVRGFEKDSTCNFFSRPLQRFLCQSANHFPHLSCFTPGIAQSCGRLSLSLCVCLFLSLSLCLSVSLSLLHILLPSLSISLSFSYCLCLLCRLYVRPSTKDL